MVENDTAHARQLDAAGLQGIASTLDELLGPVLDLVLRGRLASVEKRTENPATNTTIAAVPT